MNYCLVLEGIVVTGTLPALSASWAVPVPFDYCFRQLPASASRAEKICSPPPGICSCTDEFNTSPADRKILSGSVTLVIDSELLGGVE